MRRKDREVTDERALLKIIEECRVCRVAVQDEEGLYIVPLNFGYQFEDGILNLYFHSARDGRKVRAFQQCDKVAFEMDCGHELVEGNIACEYGFRYRSIVGGGIIKKLDSREEKEHALRQLMRQQAGIEAVFDERMLEAVFVYRLEVQWFTGKQKV